MRDDSCVDGPRLARDHLACSAEVACSHASSLLMQSGWTAGPDGVREPSPHHSNGIDVPMKRQVWLGCVGSTDCAITRHCSLATSRTRLTEERRCLFAWRRRREIHSRKPYPSAKPTIRAIAISSIGDRQTMLPSDPLTTLVRSNTSSADLSDDSRWLPVQRPSRARQRSAKL